MSLSQVQLNAKTAMSVCLYCGIVKLEPLWYNRIVGSVLYRGRFPYSFITGAVKNERFLDSFLNFKRYNNSKEFLWV